MRGVVFALDLLACVFGTLAIASGNVAALALCGLFLWAADRLERRMT